MKKIIGILMCFILCLTCFAGCGDKNDENSDVNNNSSNHTKVQVTMESGEKFVIELYPEYAPETCENFLKLVNNGFYEGKIFHRIVDGFMAQGGSSDGQGYKGSDETIKGEFSANGFSQNTLSHTRGVISMARTNDMNSASSQFFICYSDNYTGSLDGLYAGFGKVVEGMDVIDGFTEVERTYNMSGELAVPVEPIVIENMTVIE